MAWIKRQLRGNEVFVKVGGDGQPEINARGLVEIVYKLGAKAKVYKASATNLIPTGNQQDEVPFQSAEEPAPAADISANPKASKAVAADAIIIYTDGACSQNPGPMGIGAVIMDGDKREEISEFLGTGTNNIAELTAIERALQAIPRKQRSRTVMLHTDSSYCIGVLEKNWKAKANQELIARIRLLTKEFGDLRFVKVKGHAGIPENERCDYLATNAVILGGQ